MANPFQTKLTKPTVQEILRLHNAGRDPSEIAQLLDLTKTQVTTIAHSAEVERLIALPECPDVVPAAFNLASPPSGAWFRPLPGGFNTGISTRRPIAFLVVPLAVTFFAVSLYALAKHPSTTLQIVFLFSLAMLFVAAMTAAGQVRITRDGDKLTIFTGVGPLGFTQTHQWYEIQSVREEIEIYFPNRRRPFTRCTSIVLDGAKPVQFGVDISQAGREFLLNVLRTKLTERDGFRHRH